MASIAFFCPDSIAWKHPLSKFYVVGFLNLIMFLLINTGIDNADLVCVVPKGSRNIWVYEQASDKNNIGKK